MQSVDEYIKQTSIVNPHATFIYTNPKAEQTIFARVNDELPPEPKEIKPHPYGIEIGMLIKMLKATSSRTLQQFLMNDFSRVGNSTAKEICQKAAILPNTKPKDISRDQADRIMKAIKETKIIAPPTDCVVPIGKELLEKGLKKEIPAEFYSATTRSPNVYRGNPFIIEAALAYGGTLPADKQIQVLRFANRVPLLYQQGACAITKSIIKTNWKQYGLSQSNNSMPIGPVVVLVHISSVWAPFTSEAKEAIAHYPEIIKEIKLALQEIGRELGKYIRKKSRVKDELRKKSYIEKYIPFVAEALSEILNLDKSSKERTENYLHEILEKTKKVEEIKTEIDEEVKKKYEERKKLLKDFEDLDD